MNKGGGREMKEKVLYIKESGPFAWREFLYIKERGVVLQKQEGGPVYMWSPPNTAQEVEDMLNEGSQEYFGERTSNYQLVESEVQGSSLEELINLVKKGAKKADELFEAVVKEVSVKLSASNPIDANTGKGVSPGVHFV